MSPAVAGLERRASRAIHPPHVPPMQTHADITYGHGLCVCVNPRDKKGIEKVRANRHQEEGEEEEEAFSFS